MKKIFFVFFVVFLLTFSLTSTTNTYAVEEEMANLEERMDNLVRLIELQEKIDELVKQIQLREQLEEIKIEIQLSQLQERIEELMDRVLVEIELPDECTYADPSVNLNYIAPRGDYEVYDIIVENNDSYGCGRSSFVISASCPSGWDCDLKTTRKRIVPGEKYNTRITLSVPEEASPGSYKIQVSAVNESVDQQYRSTDTALYVVEDEKELIEMEEREVRCMLDVLQAQLHSRNRICEDRTMKMDCRDWGITTYTARDGCEIEELKKRGWTEVEESSQPFINKVNPREGGVNDWIKIYGRNLYITPRDSLQVEFLKNGGMVGTIGVRSARTDGTAVRFKPGLMGENISGGEYQIRVINQDKRSNTIDFKLLKDEISFIDCLEKEGVIIYSTKTCPACADLARELGGYEKIEPIYVDCSEESRLCNRRKLTNYVPEIQIEGELYEGPRTSHDLAKITGCSL